MIEVKLSRGAKSGLQVFDKYREGTRAETFEPPEFVLALRETKLR